MFNPPKCQRGWTFATDTPADAQHFSGETTGAQTHITFRYNCRTRVSTRSKCARGGQRRLGTCMCACEGRGPFAVRGIGFCPPVSRAVLWSCCWIAPLTRATFWETKRRARVSDWLKEHLVVLTLFSVKNSSATSHYWSRMCFPY